jgi:uncharacterized membrane protein
MQQSQLHYWPFSQGFFFLALFLIIQLIVLRHTYIRVGASSRMALVLLVGSLLGSYVNIPIAQLPEQEIISGRQITYYGMHYVVPVVVDWPGTVIALNVGGAVIPLVMSLYLLSKNRFWGLGGVATAWVGFVCYCMAEPVRGLGIALPIFVPILATVVAAVLLSRRYAAPLAYVSGSLGTLIGADLANLSSLPGLGAPIASIGGAGTFDAIFLTGILAAFISTFSTSSSTENSSQADNSSADRPRI